uniref:DUF2846 domain-containing protein n=1 Tax=Roseihalotalea indica TaxID=2867963 RepID=A0AA49PZC5_9BACT|nr:hypothetical protein K4G66_15500 [Tunicatimonas sp. TK19036]
MKNIILLSLFTALVSLNAFGQEFPQPSKGKSLVYFARVSGAGAIINFKYFDGEKYLGKMNGVHYFAYECDPGEHVFWVAAENRDYVTADLQPDATYILEVRPVPGVIKAAVQLNPVSPDNTRIVKRVKKIMAKKEPKALKGQEEDMSFFIKNGMERYEAVKGKAKVAVVDPSWTF